MFIKISIASLATGLMQPQDMKLPPPNAVDRSVETQFAPIGELQANEADASGSSSRQFYGTAFLVSPCHALTNAHVLYGGRRRPLQGRKYAFTFRAGVSGSTAFLGNTEATPVKLGDEALEGTGDWALLRLKTCIGSRADIGWYPNSRLSNAQLLGRKVALVGFPGSAERGTLTVSFGQVLGINSARGLLKSSVQSEAGLSGAPVFVDDGTRLVLVGLHKGAEGPQQTFLNASAVLSQPDVAAEIDAALLERGGVNANDGRNTKPIAKLQLRPAERAP